MKNTPTNGIRPFAKSSWLYVKAGEWDTFNDGANPSLSPTYPTDPGAPVELLIIGQIGKDWWSNSGVALAEFLEAFKSIPPDREIVIGINSEGGNVQDGLGIYNAIRARADKVTCRVDGYACSVASILAIAGGKTICPKTSIWMIHDPWSMAQGNADDMRKAADMLDAHAETLVAAYVSKTGKSPEQIRADMKSEIWMSGEQASQYGLASLVDFTSDSAPSSSTDQAGDSDSNTGQDEDSDEGIFSRIVSRYPRAMTELSRISARLKPKADAAKSAGGSTSAREDQYKKGPMQNNNTVPAAATTTPAVTSSTEPQASKPADTLEGAQIMARLHRLEAQREHEITARITSLVDGYVADRRVNVADRDQWIAKAKKDESVLDLLANIPRNLGGGETGSLSVISPDVRDIGNGLDNSVKASEAWRRGESASWQDVIATAMESHQIFESNEEKLRKWAINRWNGSMVKAASSTNTIDSNLQRTVILNDILRAFAKKITPLSAFSTVYNNLALQGTDTVAVPYYPLSTTASTDFVAGTGYTTNINTTDSSKTIVINKRKFQAFTYSSFVLRRQPYFNVMQHLVLKAEQLGVDIWSDVLSVVVAANYDNPATIIKPSAAFDYESIVDMSVACNQADWPTEGRALFLDSAYEGNARKDLRFVSALNSGSTETLRDGVIGRAAGFDLYQNPRIPANAQNLKGFAAFPSGIVAATSPIEPAPGVRQLLVRFELIVDPRTGIGFTYRHGGNATTDEDQEVIECAYGYSAGEAAAVKRIVSA